MISVISVISHDLCDFLWFSRFPVISNDFIWFPTISVISIVISNDSTNSYCSHRFHRFLLISWISIDSMDFNWFQGFTLKGSARVQTFWLFRSDLIDTYKMLLFMCDLTDTSCNCPPLTNAVKSDLFVKRRLATFSEIIKGGTIIHNNANMVACKKKQQSHLQPYCNKLNRLARLHIENDNWFTSLTGQFPEISEVFV